MNNRSAQSERRPLSDEEERVQIFVSYARDDDAQPPDSPEAKGFITYLYDQLQYEFLSGKPRPKVWRDTRRIGKGDLFDPVIEKALGSSAILLVALSSNWMASEYCNKELAHFAERWRREGKDVRERIVVACKRHITPDERPALLQGQQGFAFYAVDESDEVAPETEFFVRGKVQDPRYVERVEELARSLLQRAEQFGGPIDVPPPPPSVAPNGRTVYLAKPADDMREAYDRLVKELSGRGYTSFPTRKGKSPSPPRPPRGSTRRWRAPSFRSISWASGRDTRRMERSASSSSSSHAPRRKCRRPRIPARTRTAASIASYGHRRCCKTTRRKARSNAIRPTCWPSSTVSCQPTRSKAIRSANSWIS